jgi:hypothetical protein
MFYKIIVIVGIIALIIILNLDNFEKDSLGLLQLVIIDFLTIGIVYIISKRKAKICSYIFIILLAVHLLLFFNANGPGEFLNPSSYVIPFFQYATDTLRALFFFSAFMLLIPIVLYGLFVVSLANIFCQKQTLSSLPRKQNKNNYFTRIK